MKILLVQDRLRSGGTERQAVLLANTFAARGHATKLLTFRPGGALADTVAPAVVRRSLQHWDTALDWFAPNLFHFAERFDPEIVLCLGRMANCYAGSLQRHLPHAAVIATMRTGKSLPWLFRRSLRLVRHVVANSHESRDLLVERYRIPADKIAVIHNSLVFPPVSTDPAPAALARATLRMLHGAKASTLVLLNVAMFRPEKNQRELIEIAARLPAELDWQLWLAGDGPARAGCEYTVAVKRLGDRVKFLGLVRNPTPLFAAADVGVHASYSESLSNFLIESQAHGLPVVAYAAQGNAECYLPGRTGWTIPRNDRVEFGAAISELSADSAETRATRAAQARAYARTTFDPAGQVEKYRALFTRLQSVQ